MWMKPKEQLEYQRLCDDADKAIALCAYHPCPAPNPGSLIKPRACTCYAKTPEYQAFMNWRSPVCNICGGRDRCKPNCDALDAIR